MHLANTTLIDKLALAQETLTLLYANNKGIDHPAYPCTLVSDFVIRSLERTIANLPYAKMQYSGLSL